MTWLAILFVLEAGTVPTNNWVFYDEGERDVVEQELGYYTDLQADVVFAERVFVGGGVRTDMRPSSVDNWIPHWTAYDFRAGLRIGGLEAGFRHRCNHPIQTYTWSAKDLKMPSAEGAYEEIYLRFDGAMDIIRGAR